MVVAAVALQATERVVVTATVSATVTVTVPVTVVAAVRYRWLYVAKMVTVEVMLVLHGWWFWRRWL